MKTILLTGPVRSFERWSRELGSTGWKVETRALVETTSYEDFVLPDPAELDWLVFTSRAALEAVGFHADFGGKPVAVVGEATASHARELGYDVRIVGSKDAETLAHELSAPTKKRRVHWFHGNLAHGFAEALSARGARVSSTEVYATRTADFATPPATDAVFFASPSAVRAWAAKLPAPPHAIAIGATTLAAIKDQGWPTFSVLADPSPEALVRALTEI